MKHVIPAVILIVLVLVLPRILINLLFKKITYREITDNPFICPNCRNAFYVKWYKVWFKRYDIRRRKSAVFKCPDCGVTDRCRYDEYHAD